MNNLAEKSEEVNELDRIFGSQGTLSDACDGVLKAIQETRETISKGFCEKHQEFKQDILKCGVRVCESCCEELYVEGGDYGNE